MGKSGIAQAYAAAAGQVIDRSHTPPRVPAGQSSAARADLLFWDFICQSGDSR